MSLKSNVEQSKNKNCSKSQSIENLPVCDKKFRSKTWATRHNPHIFFASPSALIDRCESAYVYSNENWCRMTFHIVHMWCNGSYLCALSCDSSAKIRNGIDCGKCGIQISVPISHAWWADDVEVYFFDWTISNNNRSWMVLSWSLDVYADALWLFEVLQIVYHTPRTYSYWDSLIGECDKQYECTLALTRILPDANAFLCVHEFPKGVSAFCCSISRILSLPYELACNAVGLLGMRWTMYSHTNHTTCRNDRP